MSLQDKIAIITGSSSGIGQETAFSFHREGATVVCADLSNANGGTHEKILDLGGKTIFVKTDVTNSEDVNHLISETVSKFGRVDIIVNNAGISIELDGEGQNPVWETSTEGWDRSFQVNAKGVFLCCKYATGQMIQQNPDPSGCRGRIVNIASAVGLVGARNAVSYVASKHAVVGITRAVALDCAHHGVLCNAVCPGWVDTPMSKDLIAKAGEYMASLHPFRGLGKPKDIAQAIVFLASEKNSWSTGSAMSVDGGYTAI